MNKKSYYLLSALALIMLPMCIFCSCNGCSGDEGKDTTKMNAPVPLNISVVLDLSDRLTRELSPSQAKRDSAIVSYLVDKFIDETIKGHQLSKSKNCMRVMFYPQPSIPEIASIAELLDVNLEKAKQAEKKIILNSMKKDFPAGISQIYKSTLADNHWQGSDIWGFFSDKNVDKYCIKENFRNIVVILTDGYLYHVDNKINQGDNYSYLLPQTLANPKSGLIIKRKGLQNLEVLMLEINPYDPKTSSRMIEILESWLTGMEVQKFDVAYTAMPQNTATIIDKFFTETK